jgi:uncharacterized coiled-coil protein SlyX
MLKALQKQVFGKDQASAEAGMSSVEQELAAQLQDAIGTIEQLNTLVAEKEVTLQSLNAKLEELSKYAEAAEAQAAELAEQAKLNAINARKEKLAAVIGADNKDFEARFNALSALDDAAFGVVVEGFAAAYTKQAESDEMFKEVGTSAESTKDIDATGFDFSKFKEGK